MRAETVSGSPSSGEEDPRLGSAATQAKKVNGDGVTGLPPGIVWAYHFFDDGTGQRIDGAAAIALLERHEGWTWLHFSLSDQRACRWLAHDAPLSPAARALLISSDPHQCLEYSGGSVMGVLADMHYESHRDSFDLGRLRFAMSEHLLISARVHALHSVESTRQKVEQGTRFATALELLEGIVDQFADTMTAIASGLIETTDQIEDRVLGDAELEDSRSLVLVRRRATRLLRHVAPLKAIFARLESTVPAGLPSRISLGAGRLAQRLEGLTHELDAVLERARLLQDEIAAKTAAETNRHLYVLSVITSLLLPPTLITGIFGMNTGGLPLTKDDDGFLLAIALMIAAAALAYAILRRAGVATPDLSRRRVK